MPKRQHTTTPNLNERNQANQLLDYERLIERFVH